MSVDPRSLQTLLEKYGGDEGLYEAWRDFQLSAFEVAVVNQTAYAMRLFSASVTRLERTTRELETIWRYRAR